MPGRRQRQAYRAFTLVELLVVIGIIAILIGILIPTLNKARVQARRTACMSNMRQTLMSLQMYGNQYKEYPFNAPEGTPMFYDALYTWGRTPYYYPTAPGGLEGAPAHYRKALADGKFGSHKAMGCADSLSNDDPTVIAHSDWFPGNWLGDNNILRAAPSFIYYGCGTDPYRVGHFYTGIDTGTAQIPWRSYKSNRRMPLLMDSFIAVPGYGLITPHSRRFGFVWQQIDTTTRTYDHNLGWSDGSVQTIIRLQPVGPSVVKLVDYDWTRR